MKLDENVCRGTLIIHGQKRYVVVSPRPEPYSKGKLTCRGWCIMPVEWLEAGSISVESRVHVTENEEVEVFFPGVAYELPDYIK